MSMPDEPRYPLHFQKTLQKLFQETVQPHIEERSLMSADIRLRFKHSVIATAVHVMTITCAPMAGTS